MYWDLSYVSEGIALNAVKKTLPRKKTHSLDEGSCFVFIPTTGSPRPTVD